MESVLFGRATRLIGVLLAVLVVTSGAAVAQSADQPAWAAAAFAEYEGMVAVYNESITSVDVGVAGDQLSNERVNLVVTDADGATATMSFRMDSQLRMTELKLGERPDATLRMSTDRGTFDRIAAADNPAVAFRNAVASGDITFDGIGTTNAVKWVVINTVANLARSLGLF
jgi:hypothetical protein